MYPEVFAEIYEPSRDAPLKYFASRMDEAMMREISECDWGWGSQRYYEALFPIWKNQDFARFEECREVLALTQISELNELSIVNETQTVRKKQKGKKDQKKLAPLRGQLKKGFASAAFLISEEFDEFRYYYSIGDSIVLLIEAARHVDVGAIQSVGSYLTWKTFNCDKTHTGLSFVGFSVLIILLLDNQSKVSDREITELCEWIKETEQVERYDERLVDMSRKHRWLLGLAGISSTYQQWQKLAKDCIELTQNEGAIEILRRVSDDFRISNMKPPEL